MVIRPLQQVVVAVRSEATYAPTNGVAEATSLFERQDALLNSPALVTLIEGKTVIQITNPHNNTYTLDS